MMMNDDFGWQFGSCQLVGCALNDGLQCSYDKPCRVMYRNL